MVKTLKEKILERRTARLEKLVAFNKRRKFESDSEGSLVVAHLNNIKWSHHELMLLGGEYRLWLHDVDVTAKKVFIDGEPTNIGDKLSFTGHVDLILVPVDDHVDYENLITQNQTISSIEVEFPDKKMTLECNNSRINNKSDLYYVRFCDGWVSPDSGIGNDKGYIPVNIYDPEGNLYEFMVDLLILKN